jgi:hypothetical protein
MKDMMTLSVERTCHQPLYQMPFTYTWLLHVGNNGNWVITRWKLNKFHALPSCQIQQKLIKKSGEENSQNIP